MKPVYRARVKKGPLKKPVVPVAQAEAAEQTYYARALESEKKKTKPITKYDIPENSTALVVGEYFDLKRCQRMPYTKLFPHKVYQELLQWSFLDEAFNIEAFFLQKGIPWGTAETWREADSSLRELWEAALGNIGLRRETEIRKRDTGMLNKVQSYYSKVWHKQEEKSINDKIRMAEKGGDREVTITVKGDIQLPKGTVPVPDLEPKS